MGNGYHKAGVMLLDISPRGIIPWIVMGLWTFEILEDDAGGTQRGVEEFSSKERVFFEAVRDTVFCELLNSGFIVWQ